MAFYASTAKPDSITTMLLCLCIHTHTYISCVSNEIEISDPSIYNKMNQPATQRINHFAINRYQLYTYTYPNEYNICKHIPKKYGIECFENPQQQQNCVEMIVSE